MWFDTSVDDVGQEVTKQALENNVDLVIIAGGDGSVRAVVEGMRGQDIPVAPVPVGTGNLLARNLKLTLTDASRNVHAAFNGDERKIDLRMIRIERQDKTRDTYAFVVMAGLGLDAKMIANTDEGLKTKAGWAA